MYPCTESNLPVPNHQPKANYNHARHGPAKQRQPRAARFPDCNGNLIRGRMIHDQTSTPTFLPALFLRRPEGPIPIPFLLSACLHVCMRASPLSSLPVNVTVTVTATVTALVLSGADVVPRDCFFVCGNPHRQRHPPDVLALSRDTGIKIQLVRFQIFPSGVLKLPCEQSRPTQGGGGVSFKIAPLSHCPSGHTSCHSIGSLFSSCSRAQPSPELITRALACVCTGAYVP